MNNPIRNRASGTKTATNDTVFILQIDNTLKRHKRIKPNISACFGYFTYVNHRAEIIYRSNAPPFRQLNDLNVKKIVLLERAISALT